MHLKLPNIPYKALLLGPTLLFGLGFLLNAIVMGLNYGQMPVLVSGCTSEMFNDSVHACMTSSTHLKIISDWIVINGLGIASPGDFLEWFWDIAFWPCLVAWFALVINERNK